MLYLSLRNFNCSYFLCLEKLFKSRLVIICIMSTQQIQLPERIPITIQIWIWLKKSHKSELVELIITWAITTRVIILKLKEYVVLSSL